MMSPQNAAYDVSPQALRNDVARGARNAVMFALHVPQDTSSAQQASWPQAASFARKGKHHARKQPTRMGELFSWCERGDLNSHVG